MIKVSPWRQNYQSLSLVNCSNSFRLPLADFKPYSELYSPKVAIGTLTSAALTTFYPVLNDHHMFIASGGDPEDFDWSGRMQPHYSKLLPNVGRLYSIQVIKKIMQYYCVNNMDVGIADHYVKDILKSSVRKFARHGRSFVFLTKTITMALRADVLYRLAILTIDSAVEIRNWLSRKNRKFYLISAAKWLVKKSVKMFIASVAASIGFAVGSLVDQKFAFLGGVLATLSEIAVTPACELLLGP